MLLTAAFGVKHESDGPKRSPREVEDTLTPFSDFVLPQRMRFLVQARSLNLPDNQRVCRRNSAVVFAVPRFLEDSDFYGELLDLTCNLDRILWH